MIVSTIQASYQRLFINQCFLKVVPQLQAEIVDKLRIRIEADAKAVSLPDIGVYSFAALSARYEEQAESLLRTAAQQIHLDLGSSPGLGQAVGQTRTSIRDFVKGVEQRRKQEHAAHVAKEAERVKQQQEAQFQADLAKMTRKEAQKRRQQQDEADQRLREAQQEHSRQRLSLEQESAAATAEIARQEREMEAIRVAKAKADQEHQAELARLEQARQEAAKSWAQKRAAEREQQDQRDRALQSELAQLRSRPPQLTYKRRRRCNVY
jgi:hypothetical protein